MGLSVMVTWWKLKEDHDNSRGLLIGIVTVSILLRLIAIPGQPIHESDFYRYQWDGKVAARGINPYRFEPGALFLYEKEIETEFRDEATGVTWRGRAFDEEEKEVLDRLIALRDENSTHFERVSHPAVTTIYPPAAQWVFAVSHIIFGDSILGMKLLFVLFDTGVVIFILLILKLRGMSLCHALVYAWSPLPIKEIANSGHYDSLAILLMAAALYVAIRPAGKWGKGHSGRSVFGAGNPVQVFCGFTVSDIFALLPPREWTAILVFGPDGIYPVDCLFCHSSPLVFALLDLGSGRCFGSVSRADYLSPFLAIQSGWICDTGSIVWFLDGCEETRRDSVIGDRRRTEFFFKKNGRMEMLCRDGRPVFPQPDGLPLVFLLAAGICAFSKTNFLVGLGNSAADQLY